MTTLEVARRIVEQEFAGIVDKGGKPYTDHLFRVSAAGKTMEEKIVGMLHDLKEDRGWTTAQVLAAGFSTEIDEAIDSVSKRDGEPYMEFVRRAHANPIGRGVKRNDLNDNSDLSRIPHPTEKDHARQRKYQQALQLMDALDVESDSMNDTESAAPAP